MNEHLRNAPIVEAVIDFKVKPKEGVDFKKVENAFSREDFGYYQKGPIAEGTFAISMGPEGQIIPPSTASDLVGIRFHSSDDKYILQVRSNSFTLSRLAPYETWEILISEAKRIWEIYKTRLMPDRIMRIATRYINKLLLPLRAGDELMTYVNSFGKTPEGIPQAVEAFLQKYQLTDRSIDAHVLLSLALNSREPDGRVPFILDIDAYKEIEKKASDSMIWDEMERLRILKNNCFFGMLTERAKEIYK
jgi:uncharacterized protein (TIGR04255 family)